MSAELVAQADWYSRVSAAISAGFRFPLLLTAVDELGKSEHIRVTARLLDVENSAILRLDVLTPRQQPKLASVADLIAGMSWLERQIHDLFGVEFEGGDQTPLLYHGPGTPLRKDEFLSARQEVHWPGALEPGQSDSAPGRRKLVPPGVPDPELLADPEATAADLALSATGARVRRRR